MSPHEREKTPPPPLASDIQTRFFEEYDKDGKFLHKYTDQELIELLHFLRDMRIGDDDHYTKEDAEIEEFTRKLFPDPNFDPSQYFNSRGDHVYEFDEEDWLDTPMWKLPPPRLSQADPRMFLGMCSDSHFRGICLRQYPIDGACYSVRNVMPEMDEHISSFKVDNGCCVFYKELNCRARNIVMSGKHSLVKELPGNTDDVVGSYRCAKTCEQVWEKELVDNAEL
ncbi:hypothetical protein BZA77DRAFT_316393 [Pyronema omphalodes]|nr:hypothetical protein BZA77DRAFT_316393 [Pyronema omphalodes]